ncbi:undecaprenyl-phosphate glucose phosphotransferase [Chromohalobacter sarecensis]|uniref:Undecaprenyl-phosphate glucose phosphotransferase n=1 Tax=Chromohalobacter sarecensis TaxID=245294 RepID=A0ABV9D3Y3_9GAMM|nr:undecaprenyl-phosphate glucose phosphotransferase [Chromohalobacter sarecensis]MCK0714446.1 undecaprenyl-phosphate glucose phosphotransferase [Chromohalobacter sarecensis]
MSKSSQKIITERFPAQVFVPLIDAGAVLFSGFLAYCIRFGSTDVHDRFLLGMVIIAIFVVMANFLDGAYVRWRTTRLSNILFRLLCVWVIVALLATSIIYLAEASVRYSRLWLGMTLLFSFGISAGFRVLVMLLLKRARALGKNLRGVFLVGPQEHLLNVARGMRQSPAEGFAISGVQRMAEAPDEESLESLARRVEASGAREVWLCLPLEMGGTVRDIMFALRHQTAEVRFLPEFQDLKLLNHRISEVAGRFSIDLSVTPMTETARFLKRVEDVVLGSVFLLISLPIGAVIALILMFESSGPIVFKQHRTGVNGRRFKVYKFRSMEVHDEPSGQITQAQRGDPRVTPFGAFLRRTSLDELPQFYNVLQGRMSIVGPRPHALKHNEHYKDLVESYMKRHKVKPGITGWAQVNGFRGATDTIEKMEKRVEYDLWYIDNWSLWLDFRIIGLTVVRGFLHKNAY